MLKASTLRCLVVPKLEQLTKPTLTPDEIRRLYIAAKQPGPYSVRNVAILSLLLDTGIRASELIGLTIDNTHLSPVDAYLVIMG